MLGPLPTTAGPGFEPQHLPKTTTFLFKCVHVLERGGGMSARCVSVCGFTMEHMWQNCFFLM